MSDALVRRLSPEQRRAFLLATFYTLASDALSPSMRLLAEDAIVEAMAALGKSPQCDNAEPSLPCEESSGEGPEIVLTSTLPNEDLSDEDSSEDVSDWAD